MLLAILMIRLNFPHNLLLTNAKVLKIHKAFPNGSSSNIKLSINELHKIWQSGGFIGTLVGLLKLAIL